MIKINSNETVIYEKINDNKNIKVEFTLNKKMKCGIIGLPNVGKSTLFNSLTSLEVPAENYPFCTVDPNIGLVPVPDVRLNELTQIFKPKKITPTSIEFVDIAGLIPGAHKGEGLGNRFLSHIKEVDALIHVVRVFESENVSHVQKNINPLRDIELIQMELLLADIESLEKRKTKLIKLSKSSQDKDLKINLCLTNKLIDLLLKKETAATHYQAEEEEKEYFKDMQLLTAKPCLYICNINDTESTHNHKVIQSIKQKYHSHCVLPICISLESQIAKLSSEEEKQEFISALDLGEPGLNKLIKYSYSLLNLITFFTAGEKEVRAWTISKGTKAPRAAGKIHSDFEKGFIQAEIYSVEDIKIATSEKALKESGKYRREGKEYVVLDGDVILFRFNV